jgi:hypothetical protein
VNNSAAHASLQICAMAAMALSLQANPRSATGRARQYEQGYLSYKRLKKKATMVKLITATRQDVVSELGSGLM